MGEKGLNPEIWVDEYADYLYNYAYTRVDDRELAKDLVQETFFAGLRSAVNFKGEASEKTWLVAILKRKVIDFYRRKNSKKGKAEIRMNMQGDPGSEGSWLEKMVADTGSHDPGDSLVNEELGAALEHCMDLLPDKQGKAFRLKTIDGLSTEEICNALSINPSNLWVMVHRARKSLMSCLNEKWFQL